MQGIMGFWDELMSVSEKALKHSRQTFGLIGFLSF